MLKPTVLSQSPITRSFLEIWINRYKLDTLRLLNNCSKEQLSAAIKENGRQQTATKAMKWIKISCELAGLKTNSLFSYVPNVVSLEDARQIAKYVEKIYASLLEVYRRQSISPSWLALLDTLNHSNSTSVKVEQINAIKLPAIEQIAREVEPLILELQNRHLACQDRRTIGFMSTQFHFSTQLLLENLQPIEQILLKPYLQFIEEQVCIPWQRICAAVSQNSTDFLVLNAIKSMLSQSEEIANDVYSKTLSRFPNHRSRRGLLRESDVASSFIRDMSMFQAYLGLCVLEGNMSSVENELLPLCLMVFPAIAVDWEMVEVDVALINKCIQQRLDIKYTTLLEPRMKAMETLFKIAEPQDEPIRMAKVLPQEGDSMLLG
ncbi:MAG: hypothetical protein AAGI69_29655 [Cyanobacteria bacterium P01_H01_bin.21]